MDRKSKNWQLSPSNPKNIYRGDVARMRADKRRFGALDGDWARHCIKCGDRFAGYPSVRCPSCDDENPKNA